MLGFGVGELLIILAIVIFIFGAKRLPQLGAGVGGLIHGFRTAVRGQESSPGESGQNDRAS